METFTLIKIQPASTLSVFSDHLFYSVYNAFLPVQVRYNSLLTEDDFSLVQFIFFYSRLSLRPVPARWRLSSPGRVSLVKYSSSIKRCVETIQMLKALKYLSAPSGFSIP